MILDLHAHSVKSDDGRARVETYCQWIRKKALAIDGFVLTEHRQFDEESDYRALEDEYGLLILKGSEVETDYGHVLVFGVNEAMRGAYDFAAIDLPLAEVIERTEQCGGIAVPCHPGRPTVGLYAHYEERGAVRGVEAAQRLARRYGYRGIGGSDAHLVSKIGLCATRFEREIRDMDDLVGALRAGSFEAVTWRS
jgi:predicted metal-dependent phosphoesterase TrpH